MNASDLPAGALHIAVTGANGFIGRALQQVLRQRGHQVHGWNRKTHDFELDREPALLRRSSEVWAEQLRHVDVLVHLAARVHQLGENPQAAATLHQRINVDATLALANAARTAGVKRFVFFSTAKVYGEGGLEPYTESTEPMPMDAYAHSKLQAEQGLLALADNAMEIVIIRPPLVYGVGVGGNFRQLWKLAVSRWPLPFAALSNRRDMIALDNLTDIAARCCEDPRAAGRIFNVADARPYTLAEMIGSVRRAHGWPDRVFSLAPGLLRLLLVCLRGESDAQRLLGSFLVDSRSVRETLEWRPAVSMQQAVIRMRDAESQ